MISLAKISTPLILSLTFFLKNIIIFQVGSNIIVIIPFFLQKIIVGGAGDDLVSFGLVVILYLRVTETWCLLCLQYLLCLHHFFWKYLLCKIPKIGVFYMAFCKHNKKIKFLKHSVLSLLVQTLKNVSQKQYCHIQQYDQKSLFWQYLSGWSYYVTIIS